MFGDRGDVFGVVTALQDGWSGVRIPMGAMKEFALCVQMQGFLLSGVSYGFH
jgi:hypothetical protein